MEDGCIDSRVEFRRRDENKLNEPTRNFHSERRDFTGGSVLALLVWFGLAAGRISLYRKPAQVHGRRTNEDRHRTV